MKYQYEITSAEFFCFGGWEEEVPFSSLPVGRGLFSDPHNDPSQTGVAGTAYRTGNAGAAAGNPTVERVGRVMNEQSIMDTVTAKRTLDL